MNRLVKIIVVSLLSTVIGQTQVVCGSSCVSRYSPKSSGSCIEASQCTGAALPGLCTNNPGTICCIPSQNQGDPVLVRNRYVARNTFYEIFGKTRRSTSLYPYYIKALDDAGISTPEQISAFTAQILYETSNLTLTEEDSDGLQQEGSASLGNNQPGDGPKFRGRGIIPIRGRHMYKLLAVGISQDLEDAPELAGMPSIAFKIAAWLWSNGYQSADGSSPNTGPLKHYVTNTTYDFALMSYAIFKWEGESTMAKQRFPFWMKVIKILNATCPTEGEGSECIAGERQGVCKLASECKGRSVENLCGGPADIECCVECNNPVDLVFVVDSSGSVGAVNFKLAMDFIANVTMRFDVSASKDGTQVAFIRFSSTPEIVFNFKKFRSNNELKQAVLNVSFKRGGTRTDLALQKALTDLFRSSNSGVRTQYLGVPRILVLLTDGKNNGPVGSVIKPADSLREEGVNIFSIGVGKSIRMSELEAIASDPDKDHVFLSNSFDAVEKLVKTIQTASCNVPALLESGETMEIEIMRKTNKFFKYQNHELEEMTWLIVSPVTGLVDVQPSLTERNPLTDSIQTCASRDIITERSMLEELLKHSYCKSSPHGGIVIPSQLNKRRKTKIACVKMCSCQNIYIGVKGILSNNSFNISLLNYSDANMDIKEMFVNEKNSSEKNNISLSSSPTFPLETQVYVGSVLAATGTMATVAAYVTVSFAGKSVELKCSSKIKRKKKKKQDEENEPNEINGNHSGNDKVQDKASSTSSRPQGLVRHTSLISSMINAIRKRSSSTAELLPSNQYTNEAQEKEDWDVECNTEHVDCSAVDKNDNRYEIQIVPKKCEKNRKGASLKSNHTVSYHSGNIQNEMRNSGKNKTDLSTPRNVKYPSKVALPKSSNSKMDKKKLSLKGKSPGKRTIEKANGKPSTKNLSRKGATNIMNDNNNKNDPLNGTTRLPPIREQNKGPKAKKNSVPKPEQNCQLMTLNDDVFCEDSEALSNGTSKGIIKNNLQKINIKEIESTRNTICRNSLNNNQASSDVRKSKTSFSSITAFQSAVLCYNKRSFKLEESNAQCGSKVDGKPRKRLYPRKAQVLKVVCPCFTVFIEDGEDTSEEEAAASRERRFERDMHLSQASCVLLTQLIFMVGIHARENEIACAAAAISMNYLYLVAMVWLLIEAYYLYQITQDNKQTNSESTKSKRKYYVFAWVLPLVVVLLMAIKSRQYSSNPHCWVSMADSLDIAVSLPIVTVGLVQLIVFGLMFKVLWTYRKTTNDEDKQFKKEILKTGLRNVVCITLTVLISWLLGTVSVNIDRQVYQTTFTIWNTLQGVSFLLFHVLLNEETRQIILLIISYLKKGGVSPMEDHEHVEVEEEKEKDKKKAKKKQGHQSTNSQDRDAITDDNMNVSVKDEVRSPWVFTSEVEHALQEGQRKPHSRPSLPPTVINVAPVYGTGSKKGKPFLKNTTSVAPKVNQSLKNTSVAPKVNQSLKNKSVVPKKNVEGASTRRMKDKNTGNTKRNITRKQTHQ